MDNNVIEIRNLTKEYKIYSTPKDRVKEAIGLAGKTYHKLFRALDNVSFDVKKGETVGIIGNNGSGKSTLLKIITEVLTATSGDVVVKGRVSALLELGAGFNQEYSGIQNIYLNGRMMGYSKKEMDKRVNDIIEFADIGDFIEQPIKTYSSGMFARLAFAVAINVEPDILIVDEALSVGDLFFQNKCFKKFDELREKGVTILFVSHDIASVRQMCSRVLWIEKGVQKIFDQSDLVCDMYMDEKRMAMNQNTPRKDGANSIQTTELNALRKYPRVRQVTDRFGSEDVKIISAFFTDSNGDLTSSMTIDQNYKAHVVFETKREMKSLIVGFVLENNKGLPLFDINNYINQKETIYVEGNKAVEIVYSFKMPRLLKGTYLVSTAVAQGTQEAHQILTWLHGIMDVEIINTGYNSSYIEIPAKINVFTNNIENIEVY